MRGCFGRSTNFVWGSRPRASSRSAALRKYRKDGVIGGQVISCMQKISMIHPRVSFNSSGQLRGCVKKSFDKHADAELAARKIAFFPSCYTSHVYPSGHGERRATYKSNRIRTLPKSRHLSGDSGRACTVSTRARVARLPCDCHFQCSTTVSVPAKLLARS